MIYRDHITGHGTGLEERTRLRYNLKKERECNLLPLYSLHSLKVQNDLFVPLAVTRATAPQRCGHRPILLEMKRSNEHNQDTSLILIDVHS